MRICIFGAGAVGSHFSVRLAQAGHDVACVMRGRADDVSRSKEPKVFFWHAPAISLCR